jgi:hypothetical protein
MHVSLVTIPVAYAFGSAASNAIGHTTATRTPIATHSHRRNSHPQLRKYAGEIGCKHNSGCKAALSNEAR